MCDYCDCRSRSTVAGLAEDHERIASRLEALERALGGGDAGAAASARAGLLELLAEHTRTEEVGLYRELVAAGVPVLGLEDEHGLIDAGLRSEDPSTCAAAIAALRRHVHVEEYDLFPAAHQLLGDAAWDRLAGGQAASACPPT